MIFMAEEETKEEHRKEQKKPAKKKAAPKRKAVASSSSSTEHRLFNKYGFAFASLSDFMTLLRPSAVTPLSTASLISLDKSAIVINFCAVHTAE